MNKLKSIFLIGMLLVANMGLLFSETSGSDDFDPWGECSMMCYGPETCAGFCYELFEPSCENGFECEPPPSACEECV